MKKNFKAFMALSTLIIALIINGGILSANTLSYISVSPQNITLDLHNNYHKAVDVVAHYSDGTSNSNAIGNSIKATSSDNNVAYVIQNGGLICIHASKIGNATITLTMTENGATVSQNIYVTVVENINNNNNLSIATPRISPNGGIYDNYQNVYLISDDNSTIYYTINGGTPDTSSSQYYNNSPIRVDSNTTIRAIAYKNGVYSAEQTACFTINNNNYAVPNQPTVNIVGGTYYDTQPVFLYSSDNAEIYYTVDGSDPIYYGYHYVKTAPVNIDVSATLKAVAYKNKKISSQLSVTYIINKTSNNTTLQIPTASPSAGTYSNTQFVTLRAGSGAIIRYTIDGTEPADYSTIYSSPIAVNYNMTIKAKAYYNGLASQTMYAIYTLNNSSTIQIPTITEGSVINGIQTAVIYGESGATLRYTINGTEPTEYSIVYSSPIQLTNNMTIRAKAYKNGIASATASSIFILKDGDDLESLLTTAKSQYVAGRYDDSIATLNTLLSKDPDNEDAIQVLADNYIKKNDLITAKSRLVQFMAIYEYPRVINKYAQVCIKKGEYIEARDRILNILQKYSKETYLYQTLTDALEKLNVTGIKVYVYGKEVDFTKYDNIVPEVSNGRTLIPIRALSEALGAQVDWNPSIEKATIRLDGKTIEITNGSMIAKVNGINKTLDVAAKMNGGTRLMVPLRFISENFDREVNWFSVESLVSIISVTFKN